MQYFRAGRKFQDEGREAEECKSRTLRAEEELGEMGLIMRF